MWKEVIELRQDPRIFGIIFIAPVIQLAILGYAATTDVRNVPIVIADSDRSASSQELIARFTGSGIFDLVDVVSTEAEVDRYLEHGDAWMVLVIPPDYGQNVARGRPAVVQVLADGSDANSTNIALGYATNLVAGYSQEIAARRPDHRRGHPVVWRHRAAGACVVQSDSGKPLLHAARNFCPPAACRDVQSVVDGHRPRARGRHPRTVERDAARPVRADPRESYCRTAPSALSTW